MTERATAATPALEDDRPGSVFRFGDYELDQVRFELRRAGRLVRVQRKVFDLLASLLRERDRVVPKSELLATLWPGIHSRSRR